MRRRMVCLLLFMAFIYTSSASAAQEEADTLGLAVDTAVAAFVEEEPIYEYWKPRYYDSITVVQDIPSSSLTYEEMIKRYQNKDFEYVESISEKLNFLDKLIDRFHSFLSNLFPESNYAFNDSFYTILGVSGGLIFLFLLYKLFFSGKKVYIKLESEGEDEAEEIAFVERNLMQVDLQHYIQEALKKGNYAMAIRYQQLYNIQLLQDKGYIVWKHTKTNVELMEEVSNADMRKDFQKCTAIFDYVWFGDFAITDLDYKRYEQVFTQFQQRWS